MTAARRLGKATAHPLIALELSWFARPQRRW
jgi:hypothetical protein